MPPPALPVWYSECMLQQTTKSFVTMWHLSCCVMLLQAGPDRPPDVWLQLLELCAADSTCQRSIIRSHAQQLVQQQRDLKDLWQQLALVQQQVTGLQQQLAQQEQRSAQLQQQ